LISKITSICALFLVSTLPALAADPPPLSRDLAPPAAWTAADYAAARPLPLPRVRLDLEDLRAAAPTRQGAVRYRDAGPPTTASGHDRHLVLFDPQTRVRPAAPAPSKAYGTSGLMYSSSRVAPRAAVAQFPFRMTGKLFFQTPDGGAVCSASVIDRRLVLTAGHCVHNGNGGANGFYSDFRFVPAYRGGEAPFGEWFPSAVTVSGGWANSGGVFPAADDFAIFVMLDDAGERLGDVVGRLGWQTNSLCPNHVAIFGYPVNLDFGELMHQVSTGDCVPVENNTVVAGSDMRGGSSGGPWIQNFGVRSDGQNFGSNRGLDRVVGVTSYGPAEDMEVLYQGSSILNSVFVDIVDSLCDAAPGNC